MPTLRDQILSKINYSSFYERYFKFGKTSGDELHVKCPWHDDQHESMSVNTTTGFFKCFRCVDKEGDIFGFYQLYHNVDFETALNRLANELGIIVKEEKPKEVKSPPPIEEQVYKYMKMLESHENIKNFLMQKRGFTEQTIKRFKLGFDGDRVTIPIYDEKGQLVNIRKYSAKAKGGAKMLGIPNYNEARLFPIENVLKDSIILNEGEMDCILANQLGFNAVTVTSGAGIWKEYFTTYFKDKEIAICYDIDSPGKDGAEKIAKILHNTAKEIKIVELPISPDQIPNGDFSDYILAMGYTAQDFENLVKSMPVYGQKIEIAKDENIYDVHLSQAALAQYYNKSVTFEVIIAGKDSTPYIIPKKILIQCSPQDEKCRGCVISTQNGEYIFDFTEKDNRLLQLINIPSSVQKGIIKQIVGIKSRCSAFTYNILENMNIEELRAIPHIDFSSMDKEYVNRNIFFVGTGTKTNTRYKMTGLTVVDPRNQKATQLIYNLESSLDELSSFRMSEELYEKLKIFQPDKSIEEKLDEIYKDFEINVTRIFQRKDFHLVVDLIYHTPLQFYFQKQLIKGWGEALIVGDSSQGKSTLIQNIISHYQLGERMDSKNATRSGLIGGMEEAGTSSKRRWINWGRVPLNDRRLLVLEEIKAMDRDLIAKMTDMRSSGIAEVVGITHEKTNARTRLIWLSNPRSNLKLENYHFGVDVVKELIGSLEDIRRFDLILLLRSGDVESKYLNMKREDIPNYPHKYTSELCKSLLCWVWSRTPEQKEFTNEAEDKIIDYASILSEKYTSSVPIVEAGDVRFKLARLSIALAGRLFSTDKEGLKIIVKPEHVDFIYRKLLDIYKSKNLDYTRFIKTEGRVKFNHELFVEMKMLIDRIESLFDFLTENRVFNLMEIIDSLGLERQEAKDIVHAFFRKGLIKRTKNGYRKTPNFIEILKKMQDEKEEDGITGEIKEGIATPE